MPSITEFNLNNVALKKGDTVYEISSGSPAKQIINEIYATDNHIVVYFNNDNSAYISAPKDNIEQVLFVTAEEADLEIDKMNARKKLEKHIKSIEWARKIQRHAYVLENKATKIKSKDITAKDKKKLADAIHSYITDFETSVTQEGLTNLLIDVMFPILESEKFKITKKGRKK